MFVAVDKVSVDVVTVLLLGGVVQYHPAVVQAQHVRVPILQLIAAPSDQTKHTTLTQIITNLYRKKSLCVNFQLYATEHKKIKSSTAKIP